MLFSHTLLSVPEVQRYAIFYQRNLYLSFSNIYIFEYQRITFWYWQKLVVCQIVYNLQNDKFLMKLTLHQEKFTHDLQTKNKPRCLPATGHGETTVIQTDIRAALPSTTSSSTMASSKTMRKNKMLVIHLSLIYLKHKKMCIVTG